MFKTNFLKEKLANDQPVIGTWGALPSSTATEVIASTGLDFIIIDREHAPISFETAKNMVVSCENQGVSPLVRVADLTLSEVQRALDLGVHGIHVPNIEHPDQLNTLIRFAKYPPEGNRGFSPFTRALHYGFGDVQKRVQIINKFSLIVVHIEGINALNHLDFFIQHPHVDVLFLGLYDLSKSLGIPGAIDHPEVIHLLKKCVKKIVEGGKIAGTIATSPQRVEEFLGYGITYISYSVDCNILAGAYRSILEKFRSSSFSKA